MPVDTVVMGLGYVGLPLAQRAVSAGVEVRGFDVNGTVVAELNAGHSHIDDLADDEIVAMCEDGFAASSDPAVLGEAETVVICVPTPLSADGGPDLAHIRSAVASIAGQLRRGQTIILESTTYPGTTEELVKPLLEETGLVAGVDFHLAFSPERIDPGNPDFNVGNTPKVVGGLTPACADRACAFYARFIDTVVRAKGTREAEMTKLLENTYRHVNIALVNEMAQFCHDLDIDLWDVIRNAATKPFGFQAFYPGPGVGGHCIPIDPKYLSYKVRSSLGYPFQFVELAQQINDLMPDYVARRVAELLNEEGKALRGSTILLLGVTYKPDISDQRQSPADTVAERLREGGARLLYADPYVAAWAPRGEPVPFADDLDAALANSDVSLLLQAHSTFDVDALAAAAHLFLDTRGVTTSNTVHRL